MIKPPDLDDYLSLELEDLLWWHIQHQCGDYEKGFKLFYSSFTILVIAKCKEL